MNLIILSLSNKVADNDSNNSDILLDAHGQKFPMKNIEHLIPFFNSESEPLVTTKDKDSNRRLIYYQILAIDPNIISTKGENATLIISPNTTSTPFIRYGSTTIRCSSINVTAIQCIFPPHKQGFAEISYSPDNTLWHSSFLVKIRKTNGDTLAIVSYITYVLSIIILAYGLYRIFSKSQFCKLRKGRVNVF